MIRNRVTELFGVDHPIVQGGMQWVGTAELVSAVANAGAIGMITALTQPTPEDLRKEIARCRDMTDKPFGVNLTVLPSIRPMPYREYAQVIADCGITMVETAGSNPQQFMSIFNDSGIKVIHKCTSVRHALKAQDVGVSVVSVDGFECAGHPGEDDVTNLVLVPAVRRALYIPIIASGGIGDGCGLAAALMLGAEGVNMGTRFMCTVEAPIHENVKQAMVDSDELQTDLILRTLRNTARVAKNSVSTEVVRILNEGGVFEDVRELVAGARGRTVYETGDVEAGIWTAGLVVGLIHDIPTCAELVSRMVAEAQELISGVSATVSVRAA
ncbi:NAD(P)H-dependent flavin oxidoreductase [Streptomyces brasiliensis]|uniref:Nitronate monooxygenase n=1 Tax=Streptomyces brasiliensis TaxID=1954 RepID=A0A917UJW0_9ACTN|nr:nitronate monooxygenase family protein [Streptomyces brasiliensis]GGJ62801.1 nitronate monooxygenase [Streptomyces brasiliensis]